MKSPLPKLLDENDKPSTTLRSRKTVVWKIENVKVNQDEKLWYKHRLTYIVKSWCQISKTHLQ